MVRLIVASASINTDLHYLEVVGPVFRWTLRRGRHTWLHVRAYARVCTRIVRRTLHSEGTIHFAVAASPDG